LKSLNIDASKTIYKQKVFFNTIEYYTYIE